MSAKNPRRRRSGPSQNEPPRPRSLPPPKNRFHLLLLAGVASVAAAGWFTLHFWRSPGNASAQQLTSNSAQEATNKDQSFTLKVNRGNALLADGKPEAAVEMLTQAMRLNPDDEDVHYDLALALVQQGKTDEAIQQYGEALRIMPDYVEAHNNLGNLLMKLGRTEEAVAHFEQAIKIMPDYASAHNNLGTALQKSGRTKDALLHFREAVRINPDFWQAHFNVGASYMTEGRVTDARSEFETVLRLHPDFKPAKSALAEIDAPTKP